MSGTLRWTEEGLEYEADSKHVREIVNYFGLKEDSTRLSKDHGIEVKGCVDLRHIAVVKSSSVRDLHDAEKSGSIGLNALVETVLRQSLAEKQSTYHKIRRSNWEANSGENGSCGYCRSGIYGRSEDRRIFIRGLWWHWAANAHFSFT